MTSRLWCPAGAIPPRPSSARSCRSGRRCGARAMTPSRPRWSCATTAPPIRSCAETPAGVRPVAREPVPIEAVVGAGTEDQAAATADGAGQHPRRLPRPVHPRRRRAVDVPGRRLGRPARAPGARTSPPSSTPARASPSCPTTCSSARSCSSGPPPACRARIAIRSSTRQPRLREPGDPFTRAGAALAAEVTDLLDQYPLRELITRGEQYGVWVDRPLARFSAWYEMFPRSTGGWDKTGNPVHGTFATAAKALPRIAKMGFDVVYLPPIHPIGKVHRKGRNNSVTAAPKDVGSPWAIGSDEGGHDAVHPELGTIDDFDDFVAAARDQGLEVALDLALQCAPDHPWAKEHPRVVHRAARRHHRLRGEPAEEVPGHLPDQLRQRPRRHLRRGAAGGAVLDRRTASRSSASTTRTPSHRTSGRG